MSTVMEPSVGVSLRDPLQQTLVNECGLSEQDVEKIGRAQKLDALDFSAAAIRLNLVKPEDLERARLAVMRRRQPGRRLLKREPAATWPAGSEAGSTSDRLCGLRTELLLRHDHRSRPANVLAVLSPGPGEGRSQLAADLAQSFARAGQTTLLIDADLRQPSQHLRFGQSNSPGLADAIADQRMPPLRPLDHAGFLFLLPAGMASGNAVELLSSRTFEILLDGWAHQFDHIIIDSPPANEYPDALALGTIARRALIVNRAQHTSVNASREMLRRLEATRVEILGAVVCHF